MKKVAVIILVMILAVSLMACGNVKSDAEASPSASVSEAASPSNSPAAESNENDTIGYITDQADHFNREPFKLASLALNTSTTYTQMINDNLTKWGEVLNYDITIYNANMDYDGYINQIDVLAGQGYDGLICGVDDTLNSRVYELCKENGIAFVGGPTAFTDTEGHILWPSVNQDEYGNGAMCMDWLTENYAQYWKDSIDQATLGLIVLDFSVVSGIHAREPGVHDAFVKAFPNAANNYFTGDLVSLENGFSVAGAKQMTETIMTAHPEMKNWFVVALVDDWAVGATRAVETLNKQGNALVVSVQADAFINEIETGNTGSTYVAACAVSTAEFTGYMAANLVAILEGRATAETIWPEWVRTGDAYPCIDVPGTMITKDSYKEWLESTSFEALSAAAK